MLISDIGEISKALERYEKAEGPFEKGLQLFRNALASFSHIIFKLFHLLQVGYLSYLPSFWQV